MPARSRVHAAIRAAFLRWPLTRQIALGALDIGYQIALLPFRRRRLRGLASERNELVACTDTYNAAAERYFAAHTNPQFLLNKPFSEADAARHLIDTGVLMEAMRLRAGDEVLEIGAGSCWLSHILNRFGCPTTAVDVSPSALALGRELFERDPRTNWSLGPRFIAYDGRTLPVSDASCDRIVIHDAFHHIPNQKDLLREMHRVLRADGVVAMSEPGIGHGSTEVSLNESDATGVLENELVLEDLAALAQGCGFRDVRVVAASPLVRREVPARELSAFMGGQGFAAYWKDLCAALEQHHYILCYKGESEVTTRRPGALSANIQIRNARTEATLRPGERLLTTAWVVNSGDTRWLSREGAGLGWTRLGTHLYRDTVPRQLADFDWYRVDLPGDVPPGGRVQIDLTLPPLGTPGEYLAVFDLVVEGMTWFADRGSRTATLRILVRP